MLASKRLSQIQVGHISSVIIDDYLLICGLRVNLTATIIGNIKGHNFLWEQISGSSVGLTFLSPMNGLLLDIALEIPPATREDRLFRFWVDKGTRREQYYDIWVWASFVDNYRSNNTKDISVNDYNIVNQIGIETISAWIGYTSQYYPNEGSVTYYESKPVLLWKEPSSNNYNYLLYYSIERYDLVSKQWVIYKNNATDYIDLDISSNISYRVVATYYNKSTSQLSSVYSNIVSHNSIDTRGQNTNLIFNDHLYNAGGAFNDTNMVTNLINFTNTNLVVVEDYQTLNLANNVNDSNLVTNYVNFFNTNNIIPIESLDLITYDAAVNNNNVVTAYTVFSNINIGG